MSSCDSLRALLNAHHSSMTPFCIPDSVDLIGGVVICLIAYSWELEVMGLLSQFCLTLNFTPLTSKLFILII